MRATLIFVLTGLILLAQVDDVAGFRIRAHVRFLASDLLEGRGVGTRGGDLATEYLATQFALSGLQPAGDHGSYFQRVPLVGVKTKDDISLQLKGDAESAAPPPAAFQWGSDFVGVNQRQTPHEALDVPLVFVGHGIHAPEYGWDDYAGTDVKGKAVVLFTNEPPSTNPKFFGGPALTYYGRWSYKFEEAARQGAVACLIVHTTATAGYGWSVVQNSWSREDAELPREDQSSPALTFAGWLSEDAGGKLLSSASLTVKDALAVADTHAMNPARLLPMRLQLTVNSEIREVISRNVAAKITGADPQQRKEAVIYTAHWDHLGLSTPVKDDRIYNGAVDNATGCGTLLEVARAWAALSHKPRRTVLFVAATGEENGLLGSAYYVRHPLVPLAQSALVLNFDTLLPYGRTRDIRVMAAERTTFWSSVQALAQRMNLQLKPDPRPEQGSYYRSDQFSFARAGIPALNLKIGDDFYNQPPEYGRQLFQKYNETRYHQPADQYEESMDFSGLEQMARFGLLLGLDAANLDELPHWHPGDEFARVKR